jgi:predicted nucleic acid-binding protein
LGRDHVITPGLFAPECATALLEYVRVGETDLDDARRLLRVLLRLPSRFVPTRHLADRALMAAAETGLSVYDASYLVLAQSLAAPLYTADSRLAEAYERSELVS